MRFCVSRAGMAVALGASVLRPAHGQDFDVVHDFDGADGCPCPFADWNEPLDAEGVTAGCFAPGP